MLDALAHLTEHPEVAEAIARNGRKAACALLQRENHTDYWLRLLRAYAPLLQYEVSPDLVAERRQQASLTMSGRFYGEPGDSPGPGVAAAAEARQALAAKRKPSRASPAHVHVQDVVVKPTKTSPMFFGRRASYS